MKVTKKDLLAQGLLRNRLDVNEVKARLEAAAALTAQSTSSAFGLSIPSPIFTGENSPLSEGAVLVVPLELVDDNPYNARRVFPSAEIAHFAAALKAEGQRVPAPAFISPTVPGRYVLIEGHRRKRALKAAGITTIKLLLEKPVSPKEQYRISYLLNEERSPQTALDNALAWRRLLDDKLVEKIEDIADMTGQSTANVSKTLALMKLPQSVRDRMADTPQAVGIAVGYELSLHYAQQGEAATLALLERIISEGLGKREVERLRQNQRSKQPTGEEEMPVARRAASRPYRINAPDKSQIGVIREWESGKVTLEIQFKDAATRRKAVKALQEMFGSEA